jgi:hypothetical protein
MSLFLLGELRVPSQNDGVLGPKIRDAPTISGTQSLVTNFQYPSCDVRDSV